MTRQIQIVEQEKLDESIEIDWDNLETTTQETLTDRTLQDHLAWHCDGIWESIQSMHPDWDGVQLTIIENKTTGQRYIEITTLRKEN